MGSTAVAAETYSCLSGAGKEFEINAVSVFYDGLFKDDEKKYAKIAADAIGVPIFFHSGDQYRLYGNYLDGGPSTIEPSNNQNLALVEDFFKLLGLGGIVFDDEYVGSRI